MSSTALDGGGEPFGAGWKNYSVGVLLGILLFGLAAWSVIKSLAETEELQASFPNVLLLVADDLGYNDVGSFGDGNARTPNIDALAAEGVSFTRHYADTTCSPSRVALLTGMFPQRMGFRHNGVLIPEEYFTIAEVLKYNGYNTTAVGKWHAGSQYQEGWPLQKGFNYWFGFLTQFQLAEIVPHNSSVRLTPTYLNPALRVGNNEPQIHKGHLTDLLLKKSLGFVKQSSDNNKPWFLYHAFFAPHTPIQPEQRFAEQFDDSAEGRYQALVYQMDDAIGQLIAALRESGQYNNTLIVFLSDNGGTNQTRDNNAPFFGAKAEYYEGSFRTPMIISWPDQISLGGKIDSIAMNVDVMPTITDLIGLPGSLDSDGHSYARQLLQLDYAPAPKRSRLWEEYAWRMNATSFSYLDGIQNQRFSGLWGVANHWSDLNVDSSGKTSLTTDNGEIHQSIAARYWQASNEMATLVDSDLGSLDGNWHFDKYDWMRTPGLGGLSMGLGIGPIEVEKAKENDFPMLVAEQPGVWSLVLSSDMVLTWNVGEHQVSTEPLDLTNCKEIVLSSHTVSEVRPVNGPDRSAPQGKGTLVKIYVDDALHESTSFPDKRLSVAEIRNSTVIFDQPILARGRVYIRNLPASSKNEKFIALTDNAELQHGLAEHRRGDQLFYPYIKMTGTRLCN
ncbi:MAG: sulfatase-like hydrolase/transferase [Pseudomonadota bacterium]